MGMYAYNTVRMQSFFAGSTIHIFLCPFALRILKVVLGEGAREEWFKQAYEKNP